MRRREDVMGMPVTIDAEDSGLARAVEDAFRELRRIDERYSPFRAGSAVSRVNRGQVALDSDPELAEVARLCRLYAAATDAVFDAWPGGVFNPSGLVKSWAMDRAAAILEAAGAKRYFIDAGGDVLARGGRAPAVPWRVGIRHPVERHLVARVLEGFDIAVATSGTYEKGEHIWNRTASDLVSVTVVGRDIVEVDVWATVCFARGLPGLALLEERPGLEGFAITSGLTGYRTSGFPAAGELGVSSASAV